MYVSILRCTYVNTMLATCNALQYSLLQCNFAIRDNCLFRYSFFSILPPACYIFNKQLTGQASTGVSHPKAFQKFLIKIQLVVLYVHTIMIQLVVLYLHKIITILGLGLFLLTVCILTDSICQKPQNSTGSFDRPYMQLDTLSSLLDTLQTLPLSSQTLSRMSIICCSNGKNFIEFV